MSNEHKESNTKGHTLNDGDPKDNLESDLLETDSEEEETELTPVEQLNSASELAARKIQLAMMNAVYTQIVQDPKKVSASLLAVAERMIARFNIGLIELPDDQEMTEEEKNLISEFEKMSRNFDSDSNTFDRMQ